MHIVQVQYGDYGEGFDRFAAGGEENYYAQRYTVDFIGSLTAKHDVTVLNFSRDEAPRVLSNGVRVAGLKLYDQGQAKHLELLRVVQELAPSHLIVGAPIMPLMQWAIGQGRIRVLPLFADTFRDTSLKSRAYAVWLASMLNAPSVDVVSNHNLAASLDLFRIGVDAAKIVPFDWPAFIDPRDRPAKSAPAKDRSLKLMYVGSMMETKGVGDILQAVARLRRSGEAVELTAVGRPNDEFIKLGQTLGIEDAVHWLGMRPHSSVLELMAASDVVLVPSWHEYPEGLPMTIYEGICSRSPVIVSDHPAFSLRLRDGANAVVFKARDVDSLADAVRRLRNDDALYEKLSRDAETNAVGYLLPLKWDELISKWLSGSATDLASLREHSLLRPEYRQHLEDPMFAPHRSLKALLRVGTAVSSRALLGGGLGLLARRRAS